ncbi:MAG: hypothetical protein ACK4ZY_06655 [Sphingomonas sp.]
MAAILPSIQRETAMSFSDVCLFLAALFGFGTLLLKVVEVARRE